MESDSVLLSSDWQRFLDQVLDLQRIDPEDDWVDLPSKDADGNTVWCRYYGLRFIGYGEAGS